jgi:ABC-type Fe2+-enterobactin transport system substrate-binding protein
MKWIILAGALAFSGTAIAQDAPMTTDTTTQTAPQPPTAEQPTTTVTTTTDVTGTPTSTTVDVASPGNYTAPPPPDPASSYPRCSRTVTDHCRQPGGR